MGLPQINEFDVLIAGAGIAGSALALGLGAAGYRLALVEPVPIPPPAAAPADINAVGPRVSALSPASVRLLDRLGAWQDIAADLRSAYHAMQVWDADGSGQISFAASEIPVPELGHIIENQRLVSALQGRFVDCPGVRLLCPATVRDFRLVGGVNRVTLDDGSEIGCRLLIAADGANSPLRELAGIACRQQDCGQLAVVCTVRTGLGHQHSCWQRFLPSGPLAFLPLNQMGDDRHCSIVWSIDRDRAGTLLGLDDPQFARALGEALEFRLGSIEAVSRRLTFPLVQRHAQEYVRPGLALVADAAHSIHPLAGQGINLGLRDVAVLLEELARARQRGLPAGDTAVLRRYQRRRLTQNRLMLEAMRGFQQIFGGRDMGLRLLRNFGMNAVAGLPPLKRRFMREALGL